jgi:hypothetical protein
MSQSENNNKPRVARSADLETIDTRVARSSVVGGKAQGGALWLAHADLEAAGYLLIQAGIDLSVGEKAALLAETNARAARQGASTLRIVWDDRFGVYAGHVECVAIKPEDVTNLGCLLLDEVSYQLAPPSGLSVKFDVTGQVIRVWVHMPPGNFGCRIEVSPEPMVAGSFALQKGKGVRRALPGFAAGKWWVRAASVGDAGLSAYTVPVMVIVP